MKRALLLVFLTAILTAQTEVEITAEPHHHQVLANDQVRVFSVDVPPHADTLTHWHRHDYIYVMLGACQVVNAVQGKDPVTIKLQDAQVGFTSGPFAHIVRNQDQPFRNLTIELLQDDQLRHSTHKWDEDRGLDILQGGTKEILFVKDAVRVSEFELQPGGTAPKRPQRPVPARRGQRSQAGPQPQAQKSAATTPGSDRSSPATPIGSPQSSPTPSPTPAQRPAKFITLEFPQKGPPLLSS